MVCHQVTHKWRFLIQYLYNFWLNNNNYKYRLKRLISCINILDVTNLIKKLYINNIYIFIIKT